ncbi:MAG TPA: methylenetetrahydrofolate--tRNA-(uracil(54)-C(5))-methyltransferase (FADH(2)-oxidizing) TrmFO [Anaerolineae bacterium]|nr:methylenetetrahydrofolate--tRNA-(uracil(54)-C(5))-methyltransferase (FADH(2)-oxidizing) TrmFO [Anaerolineae bacterium]
MFPEILVIGGGLAGSEAAWQAAQRGVPVQLYEMRPHTQTPAHTGPHLAELVCSNSLGSDSLNRAPGLLKAELRRLDSLVIGVADAHRLPAGSALAVDREGFAAEVTRRIESHPRITLIREEVTALPSARPLIIASGPLTSAPLAQALQALTSSQSLYFYDAIAPIVELDSIDFTSAFRASRYGKGEQEEGDYINCPLNAEEYQRFVAALVSAERIPLRDFEQSDAHFFEACLPVEVLAGRKADALAFGPLRPVGLRDPRTGRRPYAVVQLRQDNAAGTLYNLVGFQTNLKYGEQDRVLRLIPGLENARFVRYGSMHRNTFINAPKVLHPTLQLRVQPDVFFAGQVAGLEGYAGNVAGGWLAGVNAARLVLGQSPLTLPPETMIGALMHYITHADPTNFQPMKANFGLLPPLETRQRGKRARGEVHAEHALAMLETWLQANEKAKE